MVNTALTDPGSPGGGVLVTGASTDIGRASDLSLDALGFWVFASVRKSGDGESLRQAGSGRLTPIFLDLADEQSIVTAAEKVSREVSDAGLVGLVNNGGVAIPGPLEYLPLADLRWQLEINLIGQLAVVTAWLNVVIFRYVSRCVIGPVKAYLGQVGSPKEAAACTQNRTIRVAARIAYTS